MKILKIRKWIAVGVALVPILAVVGCGGGETAADAPAPSDSRDEEVSHNPAPPGADREVDVANEPPAASAGRDLEVLAGEPVDLSGGGSSDSDGDPMTYRWQIISTPKMLKFTSEKYGPELADSPASLTNETTVNPVLQTHSAGTYELSLVVNDGTDDSAPDTVSVAARPWFVDVTGVSGIDFLHRQPRAMANPLGGGVVVVDFDGDELDDLYVNNAKGPNALYRNNGDGTFSEVAAQAGLEVDRWRSDGGCAADYDNDGDVDLYVSNYGLSRLLRNEGDGTFSDVTTTAIDGSGIPYHGKGCSWGDYDGDGLLDLVAVRHIYEDHPSKKLYTVGLFEDVGGLLLYHNEGDGSFTDVTDLLGDDIDIRSAMFRSGAATAKPGNYGNVLGAGFQPGWVDFDNDGDLDLYVVNDFGSVIQRNVLWRNDGLREEGWAAGTWNFQDTSAASGADVPLYGMALAIGDYDLDGFFDFYMTNIGQNVLLRNNGDGMTFTNTTRVAGVGVGVLGRASRVTWGAMFFDYDNDGDEDLFVVSGELQLTVAPANPAEQPNLLLRNNRDGTFTDVSLSSGLDDPGAGRGGVYLDFNSDGCLDVFVANYQQRAKLFRNGCEWGNNWLEIKTVGTTSNRDGIGARIELEAGGTTQIRQVMAGSASHSQHMLTVHFGLGKATLAELVTIRWPSGTVQTLTDVAVNQQLTVTEPQ